MYKSIPKYRVGGELAERIRRNRDRFDGENYTMEDVRKLDDYDWPGDFRGRLLLAEACHCNYDGSNRERFLALLEDTLTNYEIPYRMENETVNEQVLSGFSWLMRGIVLSAELTGDARAEAFARRLFETVYLPCAPWLELYPLTREKKDEGEAMGSINADYPHWLVSTDIGCVFISMDGLSAYYGMTKDGRAKQMLDTLTDLFEKADPVAARMQTHATLSGTRAMLRMHDLTGEKRYLSIAEKRFVLYLSKGMSETYANYNWFLRPDWSEPCAITDAFMVAMQLFHTTEASGYLDIAEKTLYNGLLTSQRENGGFGCDSCVRDEEPSLYVAAEGLYEAHWCCTMRGAEGLTFAAKEAVLEAEDHVLIALPMAGQYATSFADITIEGGYPFDGGDLKITAENVKKPFDLYIHTFLGTKHIAFIEGDISHDYSLPEETDAPGKRMKYGVIIDGEGRRITDRFRMPKRELLKTKMQVLFR